MSSTTPGGFLMYGTRAVWMKVSALLNENIHLDQFVVTSTEDRMVSTRADATHFVGCKGTVRLENCLFEHMLDDGMNVHGAYVRVDEHLGENEFICAISHPQQWGLTFAEPGDKVALLSRETVLPFFNTTQMNGILIEGDNKKWYESGAAKGVTITNNVFDNIGFGDGPVYPLFASPMLTPEQRMGEGQYHRNINFVNNTIKSFNWHLVFARSVSGLRIAGNTLEFSSDYPADSDFASIDLRYCDAVAIQDNKAQGFDRPATITRSSDTTNVQVERTDGFEAQ